MGLEVSEVDLSARHSSIIDSAYSIHFLCDGPSQGSVDWISLIKVSSGAFWLSLRIIYKH